MTPRNPTILASRLTCTMVLLLFLGAAVAWAADPPPAPTLSRGELAGVLAQADRLFADRDGPGQAQQAAQLYEQAVAVDPGNVAVNLRLVRCLIWAGYLSQGEAQAAYYRKASEVAKTCRELHPSQPGPLYWEGVAYGLMTSTEGVFKTLCLIDPIKENMEKVLEMDQDYDKGGAYRVLGRMYTKLPGLLGGDSKLAEKYLRQAMAIGPRYYLSHLYLSALYHQTGRTEEAEKLLVQVIHGRPMPGMEPEFRLWKAEAAKYLNLSRQGLPTDEDGPMSGSAPRGARVRAAAVGDNPS
ncbi:MAG: TRAP transporter TatT component family protein [Deltaproteobacteria bacterium]|nr:TRAP transporter TatT component family protein [Deltaproteobacteria bacterium]